jgi:hypothetical protein
MREAAGQAKQPLRDVLCEKGTVERSRRTDEEEFYQPHRHRRR